METKAIHWKDTFLHDLMPLGKFPNCRMMNLRQNEVIWPLFAERSFGEISCEDSVAKKDTEGLSPFL